MPKSTMKDIARIANVSVATVSYVLNNVTNQSIPEATRCHILQIAKDLEYIPNLVARSLATNKTGLAGILINKEPNPPYWRRQHHLSFVDGLERLLINAGFHTLLFTLDASNPSLDVIIERKLEAVFLIDVKNEHFYEISSKFVEGVPLILIDSLIEDKLFKQITFDFETALELAAAAIKAPYCLIMEQYNNSSLARYIQNSVNLPASAIHTVNELSDLDSFIEHASYDHAIVINEFIGNYVEQSNRFKSLTVICTCDCPEILGFQVRKITFQENKSLLAFQMMEQLLKHQEPVQQDSNQFFAKVKL
ncbi:LacI family DNA-binding transcriptional regulator [Paenibacillus caui]|uniref:LacI family DNA-binding transcriptional regulator n=1 Tax=Paenibacillus caui TaxID=2873927 RepID=UPI001CA88633|nr:LacI family DNA-binding transcriptional regulator [Paenibacillus caui]